MSRCMTCGIRNDDGLCQCPKVLLDHIAHLETLMRDVIEDLERCGMHSESVDRLREGVEAP